ncbi:MULTISPECIES: hypothetical protein [Herbaspirillum]|uniref:Uncharacterized protein n=1 Tax=Herbaspirillum huttiense TaxID=863372 RepID=A0AAJ2LVF8_9BURK|nr:MULTISPECIES: hypothetical protein [Herbaspirillum]MDR9836971.1 hypothetical protein [Herbaspirillum huttiense]
MKSLLLKRLLVAGGVIGGTGAVLVAYSFATKEVEVFAAGAVLTLAGLQCTMNAHIALIRSRL